MHNVGTNKIRVLVVDDSYFMKKLIAELLLSDPNIEVVGVAKDGLEAVEKARELKPDVITMDYNMPHMNGVEAVKKILAEKECGDPGIIMVSAYTSKDSETALEALRAGAVDFVQKPSGELSFDIEKVKDELLQKVYLAAKATIVRFPDSREILHKPIAGSQGMAQKVVVIGASTGGPPLVEEILRELPKDFSAAVIIVQHMPDFFTQKFAERLNKIVPMTVRWAQNGDVLSSGTIFIAPANTELEIKTENEHKVFQCSDYRSDYKGIHPSIDHTMAEIAHVFSENTLGVILTGMGEDGLLGMAAVKKYGGTTVAQDPETATIDSMPDSIIRAKLADHVLRPEKIAEYLIKWIH
jgi:two-component system chemotaxis response regulator CheB